MCFVSVINNSRKKLKMEFLVKNVTDCNDDVIADFDTVDYYDFLYQLGKAISDVPANQEIEASFINDAGEEMEFARYQTIPSQGNKFVREETYHDVFINNLIYNNKLWRQKTSAYKKMKQRYLTMVNPQWNNYKYYELDIINDDECIAKYGRITNGQSSTGCFGERSHSYPLHMYWIKYFEKINKGYTDQTNIKYPNINSENKAKTALIDSDKSSSNINSDANVVKDSPLAAALFKDLYSCSAQIVHNALISTDITFRQIEVARRIYKTMLQRKTVRGFNNQLTKLMALCPRNVKNVSDLLANDKTDFARIANREKSLLNSMDVMNNNSDNDNSFAGYGVQVYEATDKQKQEVLSHIWEDNLKQKVTHIYRIIDPHKQEAFNNYLKKNQIKNVKEFFHGSTNENWLSIIKYGLELNPNASITGKMFGNGIYFAPDANKSYKYSSCEGSYWANGNSDHGYLGLYATAYGNPKLSDGDEDYDRTENSTAEEVAYLQKNGYNCLHVQAGNMLMNDEIIFYTESAMLLNYLVEFKA